MAREIFALGLLTWNSVYFRMLRRALWEESVIGIKQKSNMSSFKSNKNIHKKGDGAYYVVSTSNKVCF